MTVTQKCMAEKILSRCQCLFTDRIDRRDEK